MTKALLQPIFKNNQKSKNSSIMVGQSALENSDLESKGDGQIELNTIESNALMQAY